MSEIASYTFFMQNRQIFASEAHQRSYIDIYIYIYISILLYIYIYISIYDLWAHDPHTISHIQQISLRA